MDLCFSFQCFFFFFCLIIGLVIITDRIGIPSSLRHTFNFTVTDYFINDAWNLKIGFCYTYPDIVDDISKHRFLDRARDVRIWEKSLHRDLSSKLSYIMLSPHYPEVSWGRLDLATFHPCLQIYYYLESCSNKLLIWNKLRFWGYSRPSLCSLCHSSEEDLDHIFIHCPFSHSLLLSFCQIFGFNIAHITDFDDFLLI